MARFVEMTKLLGKWRILARAPLPYLHTTLLGKPAVAPSGCAAPIVELSWPPAATGSASASAFR